MDFRPAARDVLDLLSLCMAAGPRLGGELCGAQKLLGPLPRAGHPGHRMGHSAHLPAADGQHGAGKLAERLGAFRSPTKTS